MLRLRLFFLLWSRINCAFSSENTTIDTTTGCDPSGKVVVFERESCWFKSSLLLDTFTFRSLLMGTTAFRKFLVMLCNTWGKWKYYHYLDKNRWPLIHSVTSFDSYLWLLFLRLLLAASGFYIFPPLHSSYTSWNCLQKGYSGDLMCAYKLVRCECRIPFLQGRLESMIQKVSLRKWTLMLCFLAVCISFPVINCPGRKVDCYPQLLFRSCPP